jgi:predicted patatin/cPLA2 family phospholipase
MKSTGLVLEGGGMRGVFTAGVLEFFSDQELFFPYIIGVSAGACNACSYLSRQKGRNKRVNIEYASHKEYLSLRNYISKRQLFGMDYIFNTIPNELDPFDFERFFAKSETFVVGTTNCETGEPLYFEENDSNDGLMTLLRATSSLPFMAPVVTYKGFALLDGGLSDPIPLHKAERDGCDKNVIVLTRNAGYRKEPTKLPRLLHRVYKNYPKIIEAIQNRYKIYNETMDDIEKKEKEGKVFVIRPTEPLKVGRIERRPDRLSALYDQGFSEAKKQYMELAKFLQIR